MNLRLRLPGLRSRTALIAALGVVVVAAGSGGLYVYTRAHQPQPPTATHQVTAAPTPEHVGEQTVVEPKQAVLLPVVSTKPLDATFGIAPTTPITLLFNLPVNASAVKNLLAVRVSAYGDDTNVPGKFLQ